MVDSSEEEDRELPPEIWRLVCDCLVPKQLGRLARTSRDVRTAVRGSPAFRQLLRCDGVWEDVHERSILGVAVTGDSIVTASEDHTLRILAATDGSCRAILEGHMNRVRCVCIMPDGRIVSGSRDGTLIVWARDGSHLRTLEEGPTDYVWCVAALSEDRVVSGCRGGRIYLWDVNSGREIEMFGAGSAVRCFAALPDGTLIADGGEGRLNVFDVAQGKHGNIIQSRCHTGPHEGSITSVAVPFESVVVAGRGNGSLSLWDLNADEDLIDIDDIDNVFTTRGHDAAVWALASLPNKRFLAADGDGVLKIWRADLALVPEALRSQRFPDIDSDYSGSDYSAFYSGPFPLTCLQTLRGHARAAFCLAALPDGRIVSGSMDRTLRFWAPVGTQIDRERDAPSRVS